MVHRGIRQLVESLDQDLLAKATKGCRVGAVLTGAGFAFVDPALDLAAFGRLRDAGKSLYKEWSHVSVIVFPISHHASAHYTISMSALDVTDPKTLRDIDLHSICVASRGKNQLRILGRLSCVSVNLSLDGQAFQRGTGITNGRSWFAGAAHSRRDGVFGCDTAEANFLRAH